ncbi:MAG: hypothetical protein WB710_13850 [Stellaceae bacterium]
MHPGYSEIKAPEQIVARFLLKYYGIWEKFFPGLNKRAHWHVIFMARTNSEAGISSRAIHRTLYGSYGTDIRTCIERIKDCQSEGFIRVFDAANRECAAAPGCLIGATDKLCGSFEAHWRDTLDEICAVAGHEVRPSAAAPPCGAAAISEIYRFFEACDRKWRETSEQIVRKKGLTPAYLDDAMDHLVTYQYWAIVMLLWSGSRYGSERSDPPALVVDEIISRMWDTLQLGHLAIKERVGNLIRWGFFAEETIKKHKAVSLTPAAGAAISTGLAEIMPLLADLHDKLIPERSAIGSARVA